MAKPLTKEELDHIAKMERAYSPKMIKASNKALRFQILQARIRNIDAWRNDKLAEIEKRLKKNV